MVPFVTMLRSRLLVVLAWIVILGCIWFKFYRERKGEEVTEPEAAAESVKAAEESVAAGIDTGEWVDFRVNLLARVVLMMEHLDAMNPQGGGMGVSSQLEPLCISKDPIEQLVGAALLARTGHFERAQVVSAEALEAARAMDAPERVGTVALAESVSRVINALSPESAGHVSVAPSDQEFIEARLGFTGKLLVSKATPDPAFEAEVGSVPSRLMLAIGGFLLFAGVAGIVGCVWLGMLVARAVRGRLSLYCQGASAGGASVVWIFAGWFATTLLLAMAVDEFLDLDRTMWDGAGLTLHFVAMLLPMGALAIPRLSGVPWSEAKRDIGLHFGAGFWREAGHGVLVYASAMPLLVMGAIIALVMSAIAGGGIEEASHPIQQAMAEGGIAERAALYFIAAVLAPIIEEILFRGALYRHLREATQGAGAVISIALSAFLSSLVFAAIHPQGVFFIPILGALAVAFCIGRETRGSLIAPMVAHGMNNAIILTVGIVVAS